MELSATLEAHRPAEPDVPASAEPTAELRPAVRVLLVDDDEAYRTLCARYLSRDVLHRYRIDTAASARETQQLALDSYDCILVDYFLPDGTGTDLIGAWRGSYGTLLPPVVVMSAGGGERAASEAIRTHAIDYLAKADLTASSLQRSIGNATEKGELRRLANERHRELKQTHAALERRTVEIERFYHTLSHEMKTPLTATREFVALVHDGVVGPVTEQQRELLEHALASCDQITRQFEDLLDLTRMETGKLQLVQKPADLSVVVDRCAAMFASLAEQRGISLLLDRPQRELPVMMDAGRIAQVISNLVGNAIKFTDAGGNVRLAISQRPPSRQRAGRLEVRVSDSGRGIAKADRARVFDRLYQTDRKAGTSSDAAEGLGLGLSISREIVRAHGSELRLHSRLGVGSIFLFTLAPADRPH